MHGALVGAVVALLRQRSGITQGELARLTGLTQPTVSRIERGKLELQLFDARAIARALKLELVELLAVVGRAEFHADAVVAAIGSADVCTASVATVAAEVALEFGAGR